MLVNKFSIIKILLHSKYIIFKNTHIKNYVKLKNEKEVGILNQLPIVIHYQSELGLNKLQTLFKRWKWYQYEIWVRTRTIDHVTQSWKRYRAKTDTNMCLERLIN